MFNYVVSTKDGQILKGISKQTSRDLAIRELRAAGYVVVSVKQEKPDAASMEWLLGFMGGVRHIDKVLMTKHLALMIKAGLTLTESIRILEEQSGSPRLRTILNRVGRHIEGGGGFADGLAMYPKVFSHFYVNVVRAGEVSGTLESNLEHLAEQFTKEYELRAKVKTALMYPTVVLVAALAIAFFFAAYVLPQIAHLFAGLKGIKLPWVTIMMLSVAKFAQAHASSSLVIVVGAVLSLRWLLGRKFLQPSTHWAILHLPITGRIAQDINLARFSLVFGTLLRSGVTITRSLEVTADVMENHHYRKAVRRALEDVISGHSLSEGLARSSSVFPKISVRMVNVGERSGKMEDVLGYLSDFYQLEVDSAMRNMSNLLEPVLLGVIGIMAMGIAYAIIIPIYDFISVLGRIGG